MQNFTRYSLFLIIEKPWENELILNETRVNLARQGIEEFISKEKHPDTIILTIEAAKGKWENVAARISIPGQPAGQSLQQNRQTDISHSWDGFPSPAIDTAEYWQRKMG